MERLDAIADPRHQGYVKYKSRVLLATRILSAIFYISSMRKTSEEFNSQIVMACPKRDEQKVRHDGSKCGILRLWKKQYAAGKERVMSYSNDDNTFQR